jgi:hypothetical protein
MRSNPYQFVPRHRRRRSRRRRRRRSLGRPKEARGALLGPLRVPLPPPGLADRLASLEKRGLLAHCPASFFPFFLSRAAR